MSSKNVSLKDMLPVIKEQLDSGKTVSFIPKGNSMRPMLGDGTDMVLLRKPDGKLRFSDVALYYRRETDSYVIHRVVGFQSGGCYIMLGDNNVKKEHNIRHEDVIAVVTAFYHKGKMYEVTNPLYRIYCGLLFYIRPVRRIYILVKSKFKRGKN